ncbi:adenylate/guanylate cyclase domain-containing protein [Ramlibacter sp. RBP-2]|uniref:Adenylate/guanylate cyclase domain-containing protein n=1 Tax=Ramlibacter lithotrophicus TaxID=2606681 RepID=A0A7X6DGJ5_9BURK|nr:adenylate/guanylate cyclase domain-containing protein [Ramlibacter lithotrophicus]NKE66633.1 adenylate/guanylate cyclase domain-containing protein [Ramlibacter lithotrophicus]
MKALRRHGARIAIALVPLLFALLHATDALPIGVLQRLDSIIYDARLRWTMPRTLDERIVVVDIDEKSLAEVGHWPWARVRLAELMDELFDRQQVSVVGFDVVFPEEDDTSGLQQLRRLASGDLKDEPGFVQKLQQLQGSLDYDALFARSLRQRPVVLGYYFTSDRGGRTAGVLPPPVMDKGALRGLPIKVTSWNGFGANIAPIAGATTMGGFFNPAVDPDGVVRSVPLIAEYQDRYYESLSLAVFRLLMGLPTVEPGFPPEGTVPGEYQNLESVRLRLGQKIFAIPVAEAVTTLVPFRGPGGPEGGSFRYVSASDLIAKRIPPGTLKGKIVLVGTTAPGLLDHRVTPVGETYSGVEIHANLLSGLLDNRMLVQPDYARGFDLVVLLLAGLVLALALPLLTARRALVLSAVVIAGIVALNFALYTGAGLVLPLAAALGMAIVTSALNMSYGYFVESRSKRELANLFGTYVPPELVDEMVKDPDSYSMKAASRELTVMFCDMRNFTKVSEQLQPAQVQELLNTLFNRLTDVIRSNRGTIDKYMGDCVMAFWGAPVEIEQPAHYAVKCALEMANAVRRINEEQRARGRAEIGVGIGLNTGMMFVGDMGSDIRRSYTVIGDAVNLGSRLEGLSKVYGVDIVASEATRRQAPDFAWQEIDRVRVKGKEQSVAIYWPAAPAGRIDRAAQEELQAWATFLEAYRAQDWDHCDLLLPELRRMNPKKYLYELYAQRVASLRTLPLDPEWDGTSRFETK